MNMKFSRIIATQGQILLTLVLLTKPALTGSSLHTYQPITIGYLGLSNHTKTSDDILHIMKDFTFQAASLHIQHRIVNQCDVGEALKSLFDLVDENDNLLALIVFSCTEVLKVIGSVAGYFHLSVLGLGSSSAVLKNRVQYPTLRLLSEVENTHSYARRSFIEIQGWKIVTTIAEDYEDYTLAAEDFQLMTVNSSVKIKQSKTVVHHPSDIAQAVDDIQESRILLMFGTQVFVKDVLKEMDLKGFFSIQRAIISNQDVYDVPNTTDLFYIGSATRQGMMSASIKVFPNLVMALLTQIDEYLQAAHGEVTNRKFLREFSYHGNFITRIYQYSHHNRSYRPLATYSNSTEHYLAEPVWIGRRPPLDSKVVITHRNHVKDSLLYPFSALSAIGTILAISFLVLSCKYKNIGLMKMSSPVLNCVIIIGSICLYLAVCIMGIDSSKVTDSQHRVTCVIRTCLLSIGYSLVFGPMCAKAYRVHYIIMRTKHGQRSRKRLKDWSLLLFTAGLVCLDIFFIIGWQLTDPLIILDITKLETSKSDINTDYYTESQICTSANLTQWMGVVYSYKGVLLIIGVYLAWTTRHVQIPTLNDSKSIGFLKYSYQDKTTPKVIIISQMFYSCHFIVAIILNIYVVLVASVIIVIVSISFKHDVMFSYGIVGGLILLSTTIMINILFIPKDLIEKDGISTSDFPNDELLYFVPLPKGVISLWRLPSELSNSQLCAVIMHGTGIIATSNTRRLRNDPQENIRELETQSRVLDSEVCQLENEVMRLQDLMEKERLTTSDFLNDELLYFVPLPKVVNVNAEDDIRSDNLTRRNTPKYKLKRQQQREVLHQLQEFLDGNSDSSEISRIKPSSTSQLIVPTNLPISKSFTIPPGEITPQ